MPTPKPRRVAPFILASIMAVTCLSARASDFPARPVRIVVPVPAGGPMDAMARALATELATTWKQQVVVDNRPGGNEIIAANLVANAPGDGHTLMLASDSTLSLNPQLYTKLPYDHVHGFTPIGRVAVSHMVLVVPPSLGLQTLDAFIQHAKAHRRELAYGSTGLGNITHLSMEWLSQQAGIQILNAPFQGLAPIITALLGNQVQATFGAVSVLAPYIDSGKLVALAVSGPNRAQALPRVPTFQESGFADFEASFYMAILAPGKLPAQVTDRISQDIQAITARADFQQQHMAPYALNVVSETPAQFKHYLQQERAVVQNKVRLSGVKLN
ncbi:tripartite tricarboxylate transporter substrate binding protein [Comamonas sp.]|uniref:Bug family tripartite tricarboxylate transporter substrate binding protein n=1 Tax=Comamonas sp. TaxID=34028 RepID=UPI002896B7E8|nr:tripartite tricarboxylate transporter substrate binding protein [Comamonas sp.]